MILPSNERIRIMNIEELKSLGYTALEDLHMLILDQFDGAAIAKREELELIIEKVEKAANSLGRPDRPANADSSIKVHAGADKQKVHPDADRLYKDGVKTRNFNKIKKAAYMGHPEAMNTLGSLYETGKLSEVNPEKAFRFYRLAAEHGNAKGMKNLGYCYEKGYGVKKNISEAIRLYTIAAEKGVPQARYLLGKIYMRGDGVKKDYMAAFINMKKAGAAGYEQGYLVAGDMLRLGRGVRKDMNKALEMYSKAMIDAGWHKNTLVEKKAKRLYRMAIYEWGKEPLI